MTGTWEEVQATALEVKVERLQEALAAMGVAHAICASEGRENTCAVLRACAAFLRTDVNTFTDAARALRASVPAAQNGAGPSPARKGPR